MAPEVDEAKILLASLATAKAGGIPIKIKNGVIKNPPPTPNNPDKSLLRNLQKVLILRLFELRLLVSKLPFKNL